MKTLMLIMMLSLALLTPSHGLAAGSGAPPIPNWEQSHLKEGDVATRALYVLAVCVRNRRLPAAQAMLSTNPGTAEERAALRLVLPPGEDECLYRTNSLTIRNTSLLRGALAEAIYNGAAAQPRTSAPLLSVANGGMPNTAASAGASIPRLVASCAVQRQLEASHRVVQFNPGAIGEYRALKALEPTFLSCLPLGTSLDASRLAIRAQIAEALYRAWRHAPQSFFTRK